MLAYLSCESTGNQIQHSIDRICVATGRARRKPCNLATDGSKLLDDKIQLVFAHLIDQLVCPSILSHRNPLDDLIGFITGTIPVATATKLGKTHYPFAAGP